MVDNSSSSCGSSVDADWSIVSTTGSPGRRKQQLSQQQFPGMSARASAFRIEALMELQPQQPRLPKKRRHLEVLQTPDQLEAQSDEPITFVQQQQQLQEPRCRLENRQLWQQFRALDTEMIITKTGRRMFPMVRVSFSGLQERARYHVLMDVQPVDGYRYRYAYHRSAWTVTGRADPDPPMRCFLHPDGPFTGQQLMRQAVSFEKLKLTNNSADKAQHIVLNSMHKYQARVHLMRLHTTDQGGVVGDLGAALSSVSSEHRQFIFPETVFIAVTAYQNQLITKLKIDRNPFAKGFRDTARTCSFGRSCADDRTAEAQLASGLDTVSPTMWPLHQQPQQFSSLADLQHSAGLMMLQKRLTAGSGEERLEIN